MQSIQLEQISPYMKFGDDFVITGNGDVSYLFEITHREIFSGNIGSYNDLNKNLFSLISSLEQDCIWQQLDFYYLAKKEVESIRQSYHQYNNDLESLIRPQLRHRSFLAVTIPTTTIDYYPNPVSTSYIKTNNIFKKDSFKKIISEEENVKKVKDAFFNSLKSIDDWQVNQLNSNGIAEVIYNYYSGSFDDWKTDIKESDIIDPIGVNEEYITLGKNYCGIVSMIGEPASYKNTNIMEVAPPKDIDEKIDFPTKFNKETGIAYCIGLGLPIKHVVNTAIERKNNDSLLSHMRKVNQGLTFLKGLGYHDAVEKQNEFITYQGNLAKRKGVLFKQQIQVYAESKELLSKYLNKAKEAYNKMAVGEGVQSFIENKQTANLFFSSAPGVIRENHEYMFSDSLRCVPFLPLETHISSDKTGFTWKDQFNNDIVLDMNDFKRNNHVVNNPNKSIVGASGSGKSVFGNEYISQAYNMGYHVIVLDIGGSYKLNTEINGGRYVDCSERENISFNIFDSVRNYEGKYIYEDIKREINKVDFVFNIIQKILVGKTKDVLTNPQKALFKKSIRYYYDQVNQSIENGDKDYHMSLTDYYNKFLVFYKEEIDEDDKQVFYNFAAFKAIMSDYINEGPYSFLLNGKKRFDIQKDRLVVFDARAAKAVEEIFYVLCLVIIETVETKLFSLDLDIRKLFFIDEALDFLKGEDMGEFCAEMYRKIRKSGGEMMIAMQDIKFLEGCEPDVRTSITTNSDYNIVLGLKTEESEKAARVLLGFNDEEIKQAKKIIPKRQAFMKIGENYNIIINNTLSEKTLATYTTDPKEWGIIQSYTKQYDDVIVGVEQFLTDKKTGNLKIL